MGSRVLISLALLLPAFAHAELHYGPNNPVMPRGRYAGRPLDVRERLPLVILPPSDRARYRPGPNDMVVANFFHEGRFWIARIPVSGVQDVYFQIAHSPSGLPLIEAGHDQWLFQFREGSEVELFPYQGDRPPRRNHLREIVFSTEAVTVQGDNYGILRGLFDHFARAVRCMSPEEVWIKWVTTANATIPQFRLEQPQRVKEQMLRNAVENSDRMGLREMYNTVFASCVTDALDLVDGHATYRHLGNLARRLRVLPMFPATYLRLRGLISHADFWNNPTPAFNRMFAHLAEGNENLFRYRAERSEREHRNLRVVFLAEEAALKYQRQTDFCKAYVESMANLHVHR